MGYISEMAALTVPRRCECTPAELRKFRQTYQEIYNFWIYDALEIIDLNNLVSWVYE